MHILGPYIPNPREVVNSGRWLTVLAFKQPEQEFKSNSIAETNKGGRITPGQLLWQLIHHWVTLCVVDPISAQGKAANYMTTEMLENLCKAGEKRIFAVL